MIVFVYLARHALCTSAGNARTKNNTNYFKKLFVNIKTEGEVSEARYVYVTLPVWGTRSHPLST